MSRTVVHEHDENAKHFQQPENAMRSLGAHERRIVHDMKKIEILSKFSTE